MSATTKDKLEFTPEECRQLASWLRCYLVAGMDYTRNRLLTLLENKLTKAGYDKYQE